MTYLTRTFRSYLKPSKRTRTQPDARVTITESEQKKKSSNKSRSIYLKPNKWRRVHTGARVTLPSRYLTKPEQKNNNYYRGKDN